MDIKFFDDGKHQGSGLGTSDNGPVPVPQSPGAAQYEISSQAGTPIESDTRIDGLADAGFDPNGATPEQIGGAVNPASIPQPAPGQTGYNTSGWAGQPGKSSRSS